MVMSEATRMMQSADRRDHVAMLLQRLQRAGELIALSFLEDLVVERVDAIREVDEYTALGRRGGGLLRGAQRHHAFEHGKGNEGAERFERVTTVDEPGLGLDVHKIRTGGLDW